MIDARLFQRFHLSLLEQRQNLTDWLSSTPAAKKQLRLGPTNEQAIHAHLQVLDTAIKKAEDQTLGLCEVCHDYIEPGQLEIDYASCVCLEHLSDEEKKRLELELELATKVQQALLPKQTPEIPGMAIAAFSRPAAIVGGDYFDFFQLRDEAHGLVIGDVAGHGMSASLLMASLQAALHTLAPDHDAPNEVTRRLNLLFYHNVRMTNFVTLFLARFDPVTRHLTYSNAGHNPPLLFCPGAKGSNPVRWLRPTGAAIGLVETVEFGTSTVTLAAGDVLLLYTDGITEAMNAQSEEFGQERLANVVRDGHGLSAQALVVELRNRLTAFTGGSPPQDDMTVVACKIA